MGTRIVRRVLPLALLAAIGAGVAVAATGTHTGTVNTAATKYGTVLASSNGRTLYHLTAEKRGKIACTGACAKAWPPLTIKQGSKATAGRDQAGEARDDQASRRHDPGHLQRLRAVPLRRRQEEGRCEGPGREPRLVLDRAYRRARENGCDSARDDDHHVDARRHDDHAADDDHAVLIHAGTGPPNRRPGFCDDRRRGNAARS